MSDHKYKITVIGLDYVKLPLSIELDKKVVQFSKVQVEFNV